MEIDLSKKLNLIQGDCLEVLKQLPDNSIDVVITDPPYGVRKEEEWDDKEHFLKNLEKWLYQCLRVTKTGVVWFCSGNMLPFILEKYPENYHRLLIWNKPAGSQYAGSQHNNLWYSSEMILVFKKSEDLLKKGKDSKMGYSVLNYRTIAHKEYNHPTTKPLALMEELILHYSNKGDLILDPFMGSGTTGEASLKHERRFIGIELDFEHFKTCNLRADKWKAQTRLF